MPRNPHRVPPPEELLRQKERLHAVKPRKAGRRGYYAHGGVVHDSDSIASSDSAGSWTSVEVSDYEVKYREQPRSLAVGMIGGTLPKRREAYEVGYSSSDAELGTSARRGNIRTVLLLGEKPGHLPKRWVEVTELTSESSAAGSSTDSVGSAGEFTGRKERRDLRHMEMTRRSKQRWVDKLRRRKRSARVRGGAANVLAGQTAPVPGAKHAVRGRALAGKAVFMVEPGTSISSQSSEELPMHEGEIKRRFMHPRARGRAVFRYGPRGRIQGHIERGDSASDVSSMSMTMQAEAEMNTLTEERRTHNLKAAHGGHPNINLHERRKRRELVLPQPAGLNKLLRERREKQGRPIADSAHGTVITGHPYILKGGRQRPYTGHTPLANDEVEFGMPEPVAGHVVIHVRQPKRYRRVHQGSADWSEDDVGHHIGADGTAVFRLAADEAWDSDEHEIVNARGMLRARHHRQVSGTARLSARDREVIRHKRRVKARQHNRVSHEFVPEPGYAYGDNASFVSHDIDMAQRRAERDSLLAHEQRRDMQHGRQQQIGENAIAARRADRNAQRVRKQRRNAITERRHGPEPVYPVVVAR